MSAAKKRNMSVSRVYGMLGNADRRGD